MKEERQLFEYEEAPSGAIFLYYYKQPLMKNGSGHGFQGVLAVDAEDDVVQCSLCGWWGANLSMHIRHMHRGYNAALYKEEFGLSPQTALMSESLRAQRIESGKKNVKFLRSAAVVASRKRNLAKGRLKGRKHTMERKNKHGTCPEQLLESIVRVKGELGHRPNAKEYVHAAKKGSYSAIVNTYGSWNNAVKLLGWEPMKSGRRFSYNPWTKEALLQILRDFESKNGRKASWSDSKRGLIPASGTWSKYFGGLRNARLLATRG